MYLSLHSLWNVCIDGDHIKRREENSASRYLHFVKEQTQTLDLKRPQIHAHPKTTYRCKTFFRFSIFLQDALYKNQYCDSTPTALHRGTTTEKIMGLR